MLFASIAAAATVSTAPLPTDPGLFSVRPWLLPAPVLLADGSLLRAHYHDAQFVVERWAPQGTSPAWRWSEPAPQEVAMGTPGVAADLQTLSGTSPWLLDGDDTVARVFLSSGGGSTLATLDARTGQLKSRVDESDEGFAGGLWSGDGAVATARAHAGALTVRSWGRDGRPLASLDLTVAQPPFDYLGPSWARRGVQASALGADGSLGLLVGAGKGRLQLERWSPGAPHLATPTLVDALTEPVAIRQGPDGGSLAVLRGSRGWPRYPTTDVWVCVAPAGETPTARCQALGLETLTGERPARHEVVASAPTPEGGLLIATQPVKDTYGEHSVTRRRGDILLVRLQADGAVAWAREIPFKTRSALAYTESAVTSPVTLVADGQRLVLVTAVQGAGWRQSWTLEARALDPSTGEAGAPFAVYESSHLPVTTSLDCAGPRCSVNEVGLGSGGTTRTVIFDGRPG